MNSRAQAQFGPGKGAVITLVLVSMLNVMGGAAIAPALPGISQAFPQSSETIVSLVITLPSLAVAISGFFVGALADWLGKARTLHVALVVFTITGLSGLVLPSLETLLVGRFIMGIAIAGIATTTGALISEYFDADMRAKVFGWQSAASGASVLILETSGGFLSLMGWRAPFLVYLVGILFIVLAFLFIRELPDALPHVASDSSGAQGDNPEVRGASEAPAVSGGLHHGEAPQSANGAAANSTVAANGILRVGGLALVACLVGGFVSQSLSYLVPSKMPYLLSAFGERSVVAGLFLGGFGVANIIGSLVSAPLQQRAKRTLVISICFAFLAVGCLFMTIAQGKWLVLLGAICIGLGVGCVTPLFLNWTASLSTHANSGKFMGSFATAVNLGQFSCSLFSGAILALFGTHAAVFFAGALVAVLAIACSLILRTAIDKN